MKTKQLPRQAWSTNGEEFNHDDLGDAIDYDVEVGDTVYVGDVVPIKASQLFNTCCLLDSIADRACDIAGEYAEGFPCVDKEAEKELQSFVEGWIERHCPPSFYTVENVRPYRVTKADFIHNFSDSPYHP